MTKRKVKSRRATDRLLALRIKARKARRIQRAAEAAISQALSQTLLDLAFASGNR